MKLNKKALKEEAERLQSHARLKVMQKDYHSMTAALSAALVLDAIADAIEDSE